MEYISPDRHDQNGQAERACGIIETTLKSLLMSGNLSPQWWVKAAQDAERLLNRLPPISSGYNIPLDGDRARPLEIATNFQYSRRQIDRELSYYVPVGTPCLVHDTLAKGSSLAPKVRWGIASGMYRETVKFRCPFVHSTFHSKSYTAYKLRQGLSYTTFLGLKPVGSKRRGLVLPGDEIIPEHMILQLPKPTAENPTNIIVVETCPVAAMRYELTLKINTPTIVDEYEINNMQSQRIKKTCQHCRNVQGDC